MKYFNAELSITPHITNYLGDWWETRRYNPQQEADWKL